VPSVLERSQLVEDDAVAEVDIGGRGVDPELHPKRPPGAELLGEPANREGVSGATEELFGIGQHSARASSKVLPLVTRSREAGRAMLDRAIPGRPNAGMTRHIPLRESIV